MQMDSADAVRVFQSVERKLIPVQREVVARLVPTGDKVRIPAGVFVTLTQTLGGTYTVIFNGNMARIDGENADAIGFEAEHLTFDEPQDDSIVEDHVWQTLRTVFDPEIPVNVVDLGLIYQVEIVEHSVNVKMTLTSPACGMGPVLVQDIEERLARVPNVDKVTVDIVFEPPWSREHMSEEAQINLGLF